MMADEVTAQACHDGERVEAQAMHGYQSVWMAHWMQASYKSATPACNRLRVDCELKEVKEDSGAEQHDLLGGSEVAIDSSMHAGVFGEAARATMATFSSEADTGKSKKASFDSKSFPIFNLSGKLDGRLPLQREQNGVCRVEDGKLESEAYSGNDNVSPNIAETPRAGLPSSSSDAPPKTETLVGECQALTQEVLPTAVLMKSPWDVEQKKLDVSTSLWNDFVKSASEIVPNGHDKGKTVMPHFPREPCEIYQSSYNLASQERFTSTKYHSYSSLLIREKNMSNLLDPQRSSFSRWMEAGIAHLPPDRLPGIDERLYLVRGQHHEIENYACNPNITNQTASLESTKPQNFNGVSSVVAQVPCSVHDVETMKIYNTEESSRGRPKISQTTHHFLVSKKTDVNLSDRGQFSRESIVPTKNIGNAFNEILDFSPSASDRAPEGLRLEAVGNSIKSEGKENVQDFKCPTNLKNESSAETDTMDIDALHKNSLPGDVPLQTNKCSKDSQNSLRSQAAITSAREKAIAKSVNSALLDINQEPHELLTLESPVVDRETSTSRTHSLDLDHLSHAEEHSRSNSNSSLGPDPSSRWVKRLKLSPLGSTNGTDSTKIGESSSNEKASTTFSNIIKDSKTSLEPKIVCHVEGQMVSYLPTTVSTNSKSSFTEAKKTVEITLSHPWIQRWSHNRAASSQKRHELAELHEPKSSNTQLEEFQKKQFPSIAAMALMGKALNSLSPSELTKKGSIIVWNAKGL
ncbi:F-box protein At2g16365 [Abrus precatorius]|uniref:F-box protein At2g16365 n=1 Tax=Abrus precatorius TaxID=3816 RepID=A0A8B8LDT6_ABRPR|nr:F-box protein At2g16365 [Abrus precatorius]XP_027354343.1 F-box protein At2g16365 [Abrus precatorius]